jgi:hypothetical protein
MHHLRSVHGSKTLTSGTSKVLVITNTPKKHSEEAERMLDLINSSMRSHHDEGSSGVIDPDQRFKILRIRLSSIYKKFIQHAKEESYKALGLSLSSDLARLAESYEDTKS